MCNEVIGCFKNRTKMVILIKLHIVIKCNVCNNKKGNFICNIFDYF